MYGLTHGLVAAALVFERRWGWTPLLLTGAFVLKLAYEANTGALLLPLAAGRAAVTAHLWGAVAGLLWAVTVEWFERAPRGVSWTASAGPE
ncbi:MAG: membrane associated rhomboid family serine protease [Myxococcota bacterium]|jgi:membrane associated rhomboid family serine protease